MESTKVKSLVGGKVRENILVIDVEIMNLRKITKWKEIQGGENNVYAYPNGTVSIIFSRIFIDMTLSIF